MWNFKIDEYRKKAVLEDIIIDILYEEYGRKITMHGGTCVWRCYGGKRFSRDIDLYLNKEALTIKYLKKTLFEQLREKNILIKQSRYFDSINTLSLIVQTNTKVKLDINFNFVEGGEIDYLTVSGAKKLIIALSAEDLLKEKIETYLDKIKEGKEEIQDLYDIWVLKDSVIKQSKESRYKLRLLLNKIKNKEPQNSKSLESLLIEGLSPSFEKMIGDLNKWLNDVDK